MCQIRCIYTALFTAQMTWQSRFLVNCVEIRRHIYPLEPRYPITYWEGGGHVVVVAARVIVVVYQEL